VIKRRTKSDGLPFRVYERLGKRTYNIWYKLPDGKWAFSYSCSVLDPIKVSTLRRRAIEESTRIEFGFEPTGGTSALIDAWFVWQESLPIEDTKRRADSTIAENKREAKNLKAAFGEIDPTEINKTQGYHYLDTCAAAGRGTKANKEISLLQVILEYGVRNGTLQINPLTGIRKNKVVTKKRYVTHGEIEHAINVGKQKGGTRYLVALALKTAWLCVRRSVEVRAITRDCITNEGIRWKDGKSTTKPPVLIEWSEELRETITETLNLKRNHVAGSMYLFGNMRGQKYTKGGWKAVLDDLMTDCLEEAERHKIPFQRFNLQHCRRKGVSDKLETGQDDVLDATGHTSERMIRGVYDSRLEKKAKPVK